MGVDKQPDTVRLTLPGGRCVEHGADVPRHGPDGPATKVSEVGSRGAIRADGHMQPAFWEGGVWSLGNSGRNAVARPWCAGLGRDEEEGGGDAGRGEEATVQHAFCAALLL